jgi:hypothetical protein
LKPADDLTIVFDQAGTHAQFVRDHLDIYNVGVTGLSAWYPVHLYVKNERGEILGGLIGTIWGGWLHISYLWIDEVVRGRRWATKLMDTRQKPMRASGDAIPPTSIPILFRPGRSTRSAATSCSEPSTTTPRVTRSSFSGRNCRTISRLI